MDGHHEDITRVDLMLTEPSQVRWSSGGGWVTEACVSAEAATRPIISWKVWICITDHTS